MSATDSTWAAFNAQESRLVAQAQGARLDADYWKAACQQWQDKAQALEHAKASMAQQVENLKASNAALRNAAASDRAKAALIDHVLTAEDSHLVLCEAQYLPAAQRRWTFSPLSDLAEAQAVMDRDIEASQDDEEAECHACAGTGEGQHEGASCAVCGGRGH